MAASKTEASKGTVSERFARAWGKIKNPELDGENPHFGKKYATLKATLGVIRSACEPEGIAYLQTLTPAEGGYVMRSTILADTGETMERSVFPVDTPPNPQSFGSILTYTKRQQAQADWGIAGEPDDDGNAAADDPNAGRSRNGGKPPAPKKPGKWDKFKALKAEAVALGVKDESIKEWMEATIAVDGVPKDMRSYTPGDVNICEGHVQKLIDDMRAIKAQEAPSEG